VKRPTFYRVDHGSPEWHALRRTGIGASEIPVITGDAPWGDVRVTYQDKLNLAARSAPSHAMEVGSRLEDAIRRWHADDIGERVNRVRGVYRHPEIPYIIASPDALTTRRPRRVIQIKVADSLGDEWGAEGTDQMPDHYREQVEWEMLATGVDLADLVVFVVRARRLAVFSAARDQRLSDALIRYGADFWECVQTRTPPDPPSVGRGSLIRLRADEVEADDGVAELVAQHAMAKNAYDLAEQQLDAVKDRLRARLEDVGGARGVFDDGRRFAVHYRPTKAGSEVQWELICNEMRELLLATGHDPSDIEELIDAYTAIKPGQRPLRVTISKEKRNAA